MVLVKIGVFCVAKFETWIVSVVKANNFVAKEDSGEYEIYIFEGCSMAEDIKAGKLLWIFRITLL